MAVQNKQHTIEKAADFFQPAHKTAVMSADFADRLEQQLQNKYITSYANKMTQKPFWQSSPFLGGLAFAAVAAIFVVGGVFLNNNKTLDVQPNTSPDTATTLGAELAYFEGEVEYRRGDSGWMTAESGMDLTEGDSVRTFTDGRAIINLDDGSAVRLNYDSEVELTALDPQDMKVTNVEGEVYARVARLDRDFAVVTEELDFVSLGTAYTTFNMEDKKGVKVFHSKVQVEDKTEKKELIVDEGKSYFKKDGEVKDLTLGQIKKDKFALWNKEQDEQKVSSQEELGKLSDLTAPELKINSPKNGKTVTNAKVTIKGTTEAGATVKVNGKVVENNDGSFQKQVNLSQGLNKISVKAIDAAGNFTQKTVKVTRQVAGTNSGTNNGGGSGTIVITNVQQVSNGIKVQWSVNGLSTPEGFKVVYSTGANPVYGQHSAVYFGNGTNSAVINVNNGQTYHFRVCRYTGSGCDNYSNDVSATAPVVNPVSSINASFDSVNNKITWTTNTGTTGQGFKIAFSATDPNPAYPANGIAYVDAFHYAVGQNGYYRVCAWNGGSGCTANSAVIHVTSL